MRKIFKSTEENELTRYATEHPNGTWNNFRNHNQGRDYKAIKSKLFSEQSELCAYCEVGLHEAGDNNRRVEHFHSKSDVTDEQHNVHLDWFNLLGVCVGGTDHVSKQAFELPANLSCDAYKAYIEAVENITDKNWQGKVLSPLTIPQPHKLFTFNKATGQLHPNEAYCAEYSMEDNKFESTIELVCETIRVFNLNCERLNKARLKVFHSFEKRFKVARQNNDMNILKRLTLHWSQGSPLPFQTTRNIIMEDNAITSKMLQQIQ
ncbi:conserved hypothetical protein [Vibrio nigripulchritudo SO65]|uniref:retron Ec78 anti-phage system effector HNH endonuclease PtuB n=1 Tax=Vibrio nigripulchritudo TaxID=28173 RepID=UPI0003B210FE|nr:retron Ec78 anti-phage system effector HNH endonuclease PtuB [Vibrio nigripulchritudo]CCN34644.1 conserved hypothetical protein [Vibrio nigripulchritudo AM115]CCN40544.1 conserved hypothetical protein [Vibrio nigripulchritudo FTn2]CCN63331.1 conserved hypothetical protein [Vibrio nigripulchritudo POn4]CCN75455.1 conserved hypothetical protein [Vibrio nigripulchritudo SO65]